MQELFSLEWKIKDHVALHLLSPSHCLIDIRSGKICIVKKPINIRGGHL